MQNLDQIPIEAMDARKLAADIRDFADEVESGNFVAVAFALCDRDGRGGMGCCVNQHMATPDLLDEMVYDIKTKLFESFEDDK